jgi:hypothetical protein
MSPVGVSQKGILILNLRVAEKTETICETASLSRGVRELVLVSYC